VRFLHVKSDPLTTPFPGFNSGSSSSSWWTHLVPIVHDTSVLASVAATLSPEAGTATWLPQMSEMAWSRSTSATCST